MPAYCMCQHVRGSNLCFLKGFKGQQEACHSYQGLIWDLGVSLLTFVVYLSVFLSTTALHLCIFLYVYIVIFMSSFSVSSNIYLSVLGLDETHIMPVFFLVLILPLNTVSSLCQALS